MRYGYVGVAVIASLLCLFGGAPDGKAKEPGFLAMVEADWARQEERRGRTIDDPRAVRQALASADRLLAALKSDYPASDWHAESMELARCSRRVGFVETASEQARQDLYHEIRGITRRLMVKNPLLTGRPLAFMKRRRFICQMLHEYIGYYYDYDGLHGGGVYVLEEPGLSPKTRDLIGDKLPCGNYATPAVSYDGRTIYFAFTELSEAERTRKSTGNHRDFPSAYDVPEELNYYSANRACFSLYAIDTDGSNLRQLTDGCEDDFNPCPMPDGTVVFMSSRRGGFCRCDNPFEPVPTTTLHAMDPDGSNQRILSFHETNEWHPAPINDGRIVYCRWDYVDRSAAHFHGLWACNPDGSNPLAMFGNYTKRISACYQPRSVPGSNRIAFIAGAHHADVGGSLVLFDPAWAHLDEESGEDDFRSLEILTPEVVFPEAPRPVACKFLSQPVAIVGRLLPCIVQFRAVVRDEFGSSGGHQDRDLLLRPFREPGTAVSRSGHFVDERDATGYGAASASTSERARPDARR